MSRRSLSRAGFIIGLVLLILFKLWLVRGESIVGSATQYDALWYVRSASHWYWGTPYDWVAFLRPCAYPLWLALTSWLHFPQRLAIELLQSGAAVVLIVAFRHLGVSPWVCLGCFLFLSLHPIGFQQNDYTMSDNFYAPLLWYLLGGLLLLLAHRSWWLALIAGALIAILWNTREEGILLIVLLAVWAVIFFLREKRASLLPIAITAGTAVALVTIIYSINDRVFHSFARSEMTAPVFQSLYHSLLRIKPAEPKPYAPITMDTLHRAFAVSPTLAKLRGPLDGPVGEAWRVETLRRTGTPNEIGVGWIVWATRQAAAVEGIFESPAQSRRFFIKASREINAACDASRLPTRFVVDGFLDPLVQSGGLRRFPASIGRIAARVFAQWKITLLQDDAGLTTTEVTLYNQIARRNPASRPVRRGLAAALENFISHYHCVAMFALHLLALAACVRLLFAGRSRAQYRDAWCAILLLAAAVLSRATLLAWLDATAFDATQDRFLFPILPLWSALLVLVVFLGAATFFRPNERRS